MAQCAGQAGLLLINPINLAQPFNANQHNSEDGRVVFAYTRQPAACPPKQPALRNQLRQTHQSNDRRCTMKQPHKHRPSDSFNTTTQTAVRIQESRAKFANTVLLLTLEWWAG